LCSNDHTKQFDRSGTLSRVTLPPDVLRAATGVPVAEHVCERPLLGSSGAATAEVVRLAGSVSLHGESRSFSIIGKSVRPVTSGRHAEASKRCDHLIADEDDTVAIDWGTVGVAPAGADLAHLALSSLADPMPAYLRASSAGPAEQDVLLGYQTTMALTGAIRLHWMLSNQVPVPDDYVDFVWAHRPRQLRSRRV
jgi:hypothetical protein